MHDEVIKRLKGSDYHQLPVSKKIIWIDRAKEGGDHFILESRFDCPSKKIWKTDYLLFHSRDPRAWDITTFFINPTTYKVWVLRIAPDGQKGLVSIKDGSLICVLSPEDNIF